MKKEAGEAGGGTKYLGERPEGDEALGVAGTEMATIRGVSNRECCQGRSHFGVQV